MARAAWLVTLTGGALLFGVGACEKLIGIEDTQVVTDAAGAAPIDRAGTSGDSHAGANAQGGDVEAAGATSGGKSGESGESGDDRAGMGGNANGGASPGAGGDTSVCDHCESPTPICEAGKCIARGPTEALAGSAAAQTNFYIDSTEVTNAQYAAFLTAKNGDTSGQRADCTWNDKYAPKQALGDDKRPVVNVDFCDAVAYCDWAGERLCGSLTGGSLAITDLLDPSRSQWFLACGGPDKQTYPYGSNYQEGRCNNLAAGSAIADVGKFSQCEGRYTGVYDLVGNVAEWIDSCDDQGNGDYSLDQCWIMGGTYNAREVQ